MYVKSRTLRPSRVMWRLNANQRSRAIIRALEDVDDIPTPDIIHGHWYPSAVYLATVTNELSCRYVHTEHSSTLTGKGEPSGVGENMLQILRDQAAGVIAVGPEVANALRSRGFDDVVVQPNPVDESAFNRSKSPSSGDEIRLVAVASLAPVKRHRLMLNAVRKLIDSGSRPVNLTIIGDGPLRRDIDQLVKDLGLIDNVAVTGWLDRPSVAQALARSHLYIHTSEVETFSISLVEAQMSGLPVVAIRAGGLTESIEAWQGESITAADPESVAEAMARAIGSVTDYDRDAIARDAVERFGMNAAALRLRDFYETVISPA